MAHGVEVEVIGVKAVTVAAVDLQVEEGGSDPASSEVSEPSPDGGNCTDDICIADDIDGLSSRIMAGTKSHGKVSHLVPSLCGGTRVRQGSGSGSFFLNAPAIQAPSRPRPVPTTTVPTPRLNITKSRRVSGPALRGVPLTGGRATSSTSIAGATGGATGMG